MKTEHTPTPWRIWRDMDQREPLAVVGPSEDFTCQIAMENTQAQANAAHIVLCVNSHEQLVNALQAAIAELEAAKLNSRSAAAGTLHAIKAALAAAQPKETHEG